MLYSRKYPAEKTQEKLVHIPTKDEEKTISEIEKLKHVLSLKEKIENPEVDFDVKALKKNEKAALKLLGVEL